MRRARFALLTAVLGAVIVLVPTSAPAFSLPATLASNHPFGDLHGRGPAVTNAFPVGYLGVSWTSGPGPRVRFERDGRWSSWRRAGRDVRLPTDGGRTFSELIPANDAA